MPTFLSIGKPIHSSHNEAENRYSVKQEETRKDIECGFGVLQAGFSYLRAKFNYCSKEEELCRSYKCVIVHKLLIWMSNNEQIMNDIYVTKGPADLIDGLYEEEKRPSTRRHHQSPGVPYHY